jgi:glucose-6-phosphate 1-dehydrogenase
MKTFAKPPPTVLVIFGAGGDLAWRKLVPALYNLELDKWLPQHTAILGFDKKPMSDDEFRNRLRGGVDEFSRRGRPDNALWDAFVSRLHYVAGDIENPAAFEDLARRLEKFDKQWSFPANHIFYLAVPPACIEPIVLYLGKAGLASTDLRNRIVIEKPFGHDLASAKELNRTLTMVFQESQVYRIDHYLGKETVQNILALRFANTIYEPIWNRRYIDHVQITVAEDVGVEHRGGYYDHAGALRDMVQNHLSQVMCLIAMEAPVSYNADEIRNKKVDVLHAIRPITMEDVPRFAVRGQYGEGWIRGEHVSAYRQESGVAMDSGVETFAAVKYFVDNWRWQDVPFYLRTGKRLPARTSMVTIQFHPVPHQSFPSTAMSRPEPNRLMIRIQPDEGIVQRFQAKLPGQSVRLAPVDMRFSYKESFHSTPPEAYETLLLDVMLGDATQFMRADQLEAAWQVITPILEEWESEPPMHFPNYPAGSWGPEEAEVMIARDGRHWFSPELNHAGVDTRPVAVAAE